MNFISADRRYSSARSADGVEKVHFSPTAALVVCLIFLSIVPYAGADVWSESLILAAIFALGVVSLLRQPEAAAKDAEIKRLLAPVSALAIFSFAQGLITLLTVNETLRFSSAALPYSFDLTASFWCALKFLALAVFIKLLRVEFRRNIKSLVLSLAAAGNFFALLGIFRFLAQASFPEYFERFILPELRPGIGFGTFINQNHFAFLMLMTFGINLGLFRFGKLEKDKRFLLFVFCLIAWSALVLTGSRGAIIASLVEIAVLILLPPLVGFTKDGSNARGKNYLPKFLSIGKRLAGFAALTIFLIVGIVLIGRNRVVERFEEIPSQLEAATVSGTFRRIDVWRATLAMIEDNPLYGVGFGGFRVAVSRHIDISGALVPKEAHNDYLELVASGGAVAAFCGIWFLYAFFSILKKRRARRENDFVNAARNGAMCAIAGIAVHSLFDFGLQLIANWLFLAAIFCVALYNENDDEKATREEVSANRANGNLTAGKLSAASFLISLGGLGLIFGFSRLNNFLAISDSSVFFVDGERAVIPFDADFYETKAVISARAGDHRRAAENLKEAIKYRPQDYVLRLKLAKIQTAQNLEGEAENSFRQAIRLAPIYGEPHYFYGVFLVRNKRTAEGFAALHFARRRNRGYFDETVRLAWRETGENAAETIELLSPLDAPERERLANFLLENKSFAALAGLLCREDDLSPVQRGGWTSRLFEQRQFFFARQIYRGDCDSSNSLENNLADAGFEDGEIHEGIGFGWRAGGGEKLPEAVAIELDREIFASGAASLKFIFGGDSDSSRALLSQTVVVKKNHSYRLSFAYRTEKLIGGGLPVLQVILREPDEDVKIKEIVLSPDGKAWMHFAATFKTGGQTEALEIRLAKQSCRQSLCPAFGTLWLDDFALK